MIQLLYETDESQACKSETSNTLYVNKLNLNKKMFKK